jgi:16S rRNA (cytosine967-C5)-methyltransferase
MADAPCTGSGTWRRRPDAKWRLKPEALAARITEQRAVLARGAELVKPGGRLVYVTCSILPEENTEQIALFLKGRADFQLLPTAEVWGTGMPGEPPPSANGHAYFSPLTSHAAKLCDAGVCRRLTARRGIGAMVRFLRSRRARAHEAQCEVNE